MIHWEVTDAGIRVSDKANNELLIESPDWTADGSPVDVPRTHDEAIAGTTTELRFPQSMPYVRNLGTEESFEFGNETGPRLLSTGDYLININQNVKAFIRFDASAQLSKTDDLDTFIVSFPQQTRVTLAFQSRIEQPKHTITIPPTTEGLAQAIPYLATAHEMPGPDRSLFDFRRHPPLLELGDEFDVPAALDGERPETGIELVLPDDMAALFVSAPLAYYLQANVRVTDDETPKLRAPEVDLEMELQPLPELQHDCASLLKRVFSLDCLIRNVGPHSTDLHEARLLDELDIDPYHAYEASPAERLQTYLSVPFEDIEEGVPKWHLSMHVKPVAEHISCLPFLLNTLCVIHLPKISKLEPKEFMYQSLDDFYRGDPPYYDEQSSADVPLARSINSDSTPSIDLVKPELYGGRVHGWLADEVPIDVFKTIPVTYRNRLNYLYRERGNARVTVVLNDEEMGVEHETVEEIYEERSEDLPFDVSFHEHLTCQELADVFQAPNDFVHYIGHCEKDGLQCADGYLSIVDIEESNTQTFFLNACGSYHEGIELVRKGSVTGAVTFKSVLNKQAAKVGTAFARLLVNGFSIQRAIQLARRRIMMGKDYAVVGDGTHVLTQCDNINPAMMWLEHNSVGGFTVTAEMFSARENGMYYQPYIADNKKSYLLGSKGEFTVGRQELLALLERADNPILYDGEFFWSEELLEQLSSL